ncbi:hypothetical protein K438DRAFT_1749817 [Mycena galopus ATCC 62051]|nr:hypothetical protein K438DRAFT_1749817 [Mycena galopus ATCC 62051]
MPVQILDLEGSESPASLQVEQARAQERLDAYRYPILTLPNEITSEIFVHFLPNYPHAPPVIGIDSPVGLTLVCHKWRDIALGTPALWRATGTNIFGLNLGQQSRITDIWLQRSGSCPLSITTRSRLVSMARTLVDQRARWEYLTLDVYGSPLLAIDGPMPLLRYLDLALEDSAKPVFRFDEASLLRTAILRRHTVLKVTLPWGQLTSLTLIDPDPCHCFSILQQTANLVHCNLYFWSHKFVVLGDDITLPHLDSLILTLGPQMEGFLHNFVTPALRSLKLSEAALGSQLAPTVSLQSFISKSGCSLQEVCITQGDVKHRNSYLAAFPSIPHFFFADCYGSVDGEEFELEGNGD